MHSSVGQERHQVKCGPLKLTDFKIHAVAALFKPHHRSPLFRVLSSNILASWLSRMRAGSHQAARSLLLILRIIAVIAGKADRPVLPIPSILVDKGAERFVSGNFDHELAAEVIAVVNDDNLLRARHHGVGLL
jgi:hypothetical protein